MIGLKSCLFFSTEVPTEGSHVDVSLLFSQFDLEKVLRDGASLLGSEGAQFNKEEKVTGQCSDIIKASTHGNSKTACLN